jgi:HD-GYP domain-containing protein (c-di-GMP phosphodiesterase class II)
VTVGHPGPLWAATTAIADLTAQRGRQFDPALVDAFVALVPGLDEDWPADSLPPDADIGVLTFDPAASAPRSVHFGPT